MRLRCLPASNAPRSVRPPKAEERKVRPWTAEWVAAIRSRLPARYRALADCGAGLGLRQGEALGLAADDINFLRQVVHVRRQVKIVSGPLCFGPPKGGKEREIPLPGEVGLRLAEHIRQRPPAAVEPPWQSPGGRPETAALVFTTSAGGAVNRHQWNDAAWKPALRLPGIPVSRDAGFHQPAITSPARCWPTGWTYGRWRPTSATTTRGSRCGPIRT